MTSPGRQQAALDPLARHSAAPEELRRLIAAERTGAPFVAFRDPNGLCLHQLAERTTIGRRSALDVAIVWDREVSGLHALLEHVEGECSIVDAGSTNGTYVNEVRLQARRRLRNGDRIRVGRTIMAFNAALPADIPSTDLAADRPPIQLTPPQRRLLTELCRPYGSGSAHPSPPSNQELAAALHVSVDTVKSTLKQIYGGFALEAVPQGQRRAVLAETVLHTGLIRPDAP